MSLEGKMEALNRALRESLPHMRKVADENPNAQVLMRALKFSHGASWHIAKPTLLSDFNWTNLVADPMQKATVDIVFMMDTSGSMGDEIESVKASCSSFADHIIKVGANVRLGLLGFDIGGHRGSGERGYRVQNLSRYTIGTWPLDSPQNFKKNIQSLTLCLFGGGGCYLAENDTLDMFPHVVRAFSGDPQNSRVLVIISDEIGSNAGVESIVSTLRAASITAHVLGVARSGGAHEQIARKTGGHFWDINQSKGSQSFTALLDVVAETIAKEVTKQLADGTTSAGTDMGQALKTVAKELHVPPMNERALPPVLVLVSDGQPTDDFKSGLRELMNLGWGKKAVRMAIAIGEDADHRVLQEFIGPGEIHPLQANNPDALVAYVKWVSTAVLKSASQPASQATGTTTGIHVPIPVAPDMGPASANDVW